MNSNATRQKAYNVVLVGHCGPDSSFLRMAVSGAVSDALVTMADTDEELALAVDAEPDLMLFNRVMDYGFDEQDGVGLLARVKRENPGLAVMMISNYPEAQDAAEKAGAAPGFGKREIGTDKSRQRLRAALGLD